MSYASSYYSFSSANSLPRPEQMSFDQLVEYAEKGGPRRERWKNRLAGLVDRDRVGAGIYLESAAVGFAAGQFPHLTHMLIEGGYSGGGMTTVGLQILLQFPTQFLMFPLSRKAAEYRKAFAERQRRSQVDLSNAAQPTLSTLGAAAGPPQSPLDRWVAIHRSFVEQGASPADAVKRANKAVYGHEKGPDQPATLGH